MRTPAVVAAGGALVLAAGLVWHSAYAGFSDATTPLALPTVSTGALTLVDDDSAQRMFVATGIKPGASGTGCVAVTAGGSPATVRLYGTGRATTNALSGQLRLTVELGAPGSRGGASNCNGFTSAGTVYNGTLAAFPTDSWTTGVGSWTTTGSAATARVYRIGWSLPTTAPNSVQNGTASLTFVWEARTK